MSSLTTQKTSSTKILPLLSSDIATLAESHQGHFESSSSIDHRRSIGHFGTPVKIARYMASMFSIPSTDTIRLLDAGAGVGTLAAAVCDRVADLEKPKRLEIVLYENETTIVPLLKRTMEGARSRLAKGGHSLDYTIVTDDFILSNQNAQPSLFGNGKVSSGQFDWVIMNPPYFKISRNSPHANAMEHIIHGQPNIYALFMAQGIELLKDDGEIVAITPRSYCSGLYFRSFRQWLLKHVNPTHIHIFESRTEAFQESEVLQEIMILAAQRHGRARQIKLTVSNGKEFEGVLSQSISLQTLMDDSRGEQIIRIPSHPRDLEVMEIMDAWPNRFDKQGLRISTGPIVMFRAPQAFLKHNSDKDTVPLLSSQNVRPFLMIWPSSKAVSKTEHIEVVPETESLLIPNKNYLLIKRFTSKEERRRIVAGIHRKRQRIHEWLGLENHLNYVYKANHEELTETELFGLAAIFNSAIMDRYFRALNGNTQVNASDIKSIPLPSSTAIEAIGREVQRISDYNPVEIEGIILNTLSINGKLRNYLMEMAA